ncbi:MAG TPA: nucleotidyl transferase AbiEii/AbiGii toxin family protein [Candidatus Omnitrophota bacterium]|nr:nucleotidyl transferase AbiEii/AbiGii toxin family protein [Candidatus Omnitrophota bacterium]
MLTFEALSEDAKLRGMPTANTRGILREYLQILILKEMYQLPAGRKLFFTGETYLRLAHQTKRFSENLDFNVSAMSKIEFESVLQKIQATLKKTGVNTNLEFEHWGNLFVAELIFPDIEKFYGIVLPHSKKEGIVIKVEANNPKWNIKTQTLAITGFGQMYPVICTDKGALFADKIDALLKKNRARHLFDIIFMLSKKYPVDSYVLKSLGITENPFDVIVKCVNSFSIEELKKQAESLRPFLFDEREADLIINAPAIVKQLLEMD